MRAPGSMGTPLPLSTPTFNVSDSRRRRLTAAAVSVLLAVHAWLALSASREKSATVDEVAHLTAGLAYWQHNDYRLQPENGNLPQRWAALPAWLAGKTLPPAEHPDWPVANVWGLGRDYFAAQGSALDDLLFAGRAMNLVWSLATGLLVWWWTRRLFGDAGAFVALALFTFCPTFLAHGALATSDMCMTFFMLASVGAYWRHLQDFRLGTGLLSAAVLGLACVAKFSFVLLPLMLAPLLVWRVLARPPLPWRGRLHHRRTVKAGLLLASAAVHILAAWLIIWSFFGFRHGAAGPGLPELADYHRPWSIVLASLEDKGAWFDTVRQWRLLPDAFFYGFAFVVDMSQMRGAFLNGAYSVTGWVEFFPYAFLVKTPLPLLLALPAGLAVVGWRWRQQPRAMGADLVRVMPLLALFAVYWLFSITSNLNIGHRHILPTYPVLFIFCGALGWWAAQARRRIAAGAVVALLLVAQAAASFQVRPHYLAFFNQLVGGPAQGYQHLVDSSLDWGQDLPGLARWLEAQPDVVAGETKVYLSYFGTADPGHYGIRARPLPHLPKAGYSAQWHALQPGIYAVGATMLSHVYAPVQGPWTAEVEREYQTLRALEPALLHYARTPAARDEIAAIAPHEQWVKTWDRYEDLRFARLCHYLRARRPDDHIGYSILLYRLTSSELDAALHGPASVLDEAIGRARAAR